MERPVMRYYPHSSRMTNHTQSPAPARCDRLTASHPSVEIMHAPASLLSPKQRAPHCLSCRSHESLGSLARCCAPFAASMSKPPPAASAADESLGHAVVFAPVDAVAGHKADADSISVTMTDEEVVAQTKAHICYFFYLSLLCLCGCDARLCLKSQLLQHSSEMKEVVQSTFSTASCRPLLHLHAPHRRPHRPRS